MNNQTRNDNGMKIQKSIIKRGRSRGGNSDVPESNHGHDCLVEAGAPVFRSKGIKQMSTISKHIKILNFQQN